MIGMMPILIRSLYARLNGFPICYRHDSVHQKNNKAVETKDIYCKSIISMENMALTIMTNNNSWAHTTQSGSIKIIPFFKLGKGRLTEMLEYNYRNLSLTI